MSIDLDQAEAAFAASVDGTVGVEEEFAVLDPVTLELVPRFEDLRDASEADEVLGDAIAGELISSEVEIRSGPGSDIHDALARQREVRARLFGLAASQGVVLGSTGTHPWADYREQRNIDTEHYRRVVEGLQYVARRNNTFALHVHVGIQGADRAVRTCDRLRHVLPTLLAAGANSPFLEAQDTGLHSARSQIFTKSFPRCGVPDGYGSWSVYRDYLEILQATNSIVESTQVWWSIRPHLAFGTVEVRICDAQSTGPESESLVALTVACVLQAARDEAEGVPFTEQPARMIEENMWRAIRFGMDGRLIDLDRRQEEPARAAVDRLLAWSAPVRTEHRIEVALPEQNGAQRQRAALARGDDLRTIYAEAVEHTRSTYAPSEVPAQ